MSRAALTYRVKLRRISADLAKAYPPDGETRAWWEGLKRALGTSSSAFVNASLLQLQTAARLPFVGSRKPRECRTCHDEPPARRTRSSGALAVQRPARTLQRWRSSPGSEVGIGVSCSGGARIGRGSVMRAYATQVEVLRRLRHGGNSTSRRARLRR